MRKNYTKSFITLLLIVLACSLILPNLFSAENEYWIDEGYHNALTTYQYQSFAGYKNEQPQFNSITITEEQSIKYWLHVPEEEGKNESKPLIVYIGGSSQMQYAPYSLNNFTLLSTDTITQLKEDNIDNYLKSEYYGTYLYENESFEIFSSSSFLDNIEKYQEDCYKLFVKLPDTMFWKCGDYDLLTIRTVSEYFKDDKLIKRIGAINEESGSSTIIETDDRVTSIINYTDTYQLCLYIKEEGTNEWYEIDNQFYTINDNTTIVLKKEFLKQLGYNNCSLKIECANEDVGFYQQEEIVKEINFVINEESSQSEVKSYYASYNSTYDASRLSSNVYSQVLMSLINKLEKEYNIDYQRECIAGFSVGATFAFDTIAHYPNKFASAILIAPTSVDITPETTGKLRNMNIWCFISEDDHSCNKYLVKELVDAINKNSGNNKIGTAQYTIFKATGHSDQIFKDYEMSKYEAYQKNTELLQNSKELKSNEDVCDFIFASKREDISKEDFQNSKIELVIERQENESENYVDYLLVCKGTVMDCQQMGFVVRHDGLGQSSEGVNFVGYKKNKSFLGSQQASVVTIGKREIKAIDYGCDYISVFTLTDVPIEAALTIKAYAISDMGIIFSNEIEVKDAN